MFLVSLLLLGFVWLFFCFVSVFFVCVCLLFYFVLFTENKGILKDRNEKRNKRNWTLKFKSSGPTSSDFLYYTGQAYLCSPHQSDKDKAS